MSGKRSVKGDISNKKYQMSQESILNMNVNVVREQWELIKKNLPNADFGLYEDLKSIMNSLFLLCSETGFLDEGKDILNKGTMGLMRGYIESEYCNKPEIKKKGKQLSLSTTDINNQLDFSTDDSSSRAEILANMMLVSNIMSHLVDENDLEIKFTETGKDKKEKIKRIFREIKDKCIEELVECKRNDEELFLEIKKDDDGKDKLYVAIPGYFEPFCVHTKGKKYKIENWDNIDFTNFDITKMFDLVSTLPFKVSKEKEAIIREYLDPRITQPEELKGIKDRLLWYLNTQDRFEEIRRIKEKSKKEELKKEELKTTPELDKISKEEETKKRKRTKKPEKAEEFKRINSEFLEKINEQLGGIIGTNMVDKFLQRASYSFENLINLKLKTLVQPFLEDKALDENQINNELLKLFIYMRMFSKLSVINISRVDDKKSIELVKEALENYEKAFKFMQNNKDKNLTYENMKKNIQKYLANKETVKEEYQPEESESEIEEQEDYEAEESELEAEEQQEYEPEESEPEIEEQEEKTKIDENQEQKGVNQDWEELKKIDDSIKDAKEKKVEAKKSIEELKEWKNEIKDSIKKCEDEIDQLTQSDEDKDTIIEYIKELRKLIKEQKSLRREIKLEIKRYKLQKEQAKYTIKENRLRKGEISDRL